MPEQRICGAMDKRQAPFPFSSPAFGWTISAHGALVMPGVIQDGWAHNCALVMGTSGKALRLRTRW